MSAHLYLVRVLCKVVVCMLSICKFHGMHIHVHYMHLSLVEDCVIPLFAADVLDEGCSCRVAGMKSRLQCRQSAEMLPFWSLYNWRDQSLQRTIPVLLTAWPDHAYLSHEPYKPLDVGWVT